MADNVKSQLECVLNTLLNIMKKRGNVRKDLKQDIVHSVNPLRNIFVNLKNKEEEYTTRIHQLEGG
jgi:predicted nucleic acid-binding OB-fold protein